VNKGEKREEAAVLLVHEVGVINDLGDLCEDRAAPRPRV
jgi:hypothetical protein